MTPLPWGRTGRVTLQESLQEPDDRYVRVDGEFFGHAMQVWCPQRGWCGFEAGLTVQSPTLPTRDHAVMWVLRRATPDVWRAERPVVWRVLRAWEQFPVLPWHVHGPDGSNPDSGYCVLEHANSAGNVEYAITLADRLARAEHEQATR